MANMKAWLAANGEAAIMAGSSSPKFVEDLGPSGWIERKLKAVDAAGVNEFGVPKSMGSVTGTFSRPLNLPTYLLGTLKGERGEQGNVRGDSLEYIRNNWDLVKREPVYVEVDPFGRAWVSEGNHRIMVARELGERTLPVEVRYFTGGQQKAGPWAPDELLALDAQSRRAASGQAFKLEVTEDADGETIYGITVHSAESGGNAFVQADSSPDGLYTINESGIPDDQRGKGLGVALYERLIEEVQKRGGRVASDGSVSNEAQRVYASLEKRGYAVTQSPDAEIDPDDGSISTPDGSPVYEISGDPNQRPGTSAASGQPQTAEFKQWFGDSKVVDDKGQPLVVYHGTDEEFTEFDIRKARNGRWGKGFYFADTPERAKEYGKNVMPVYLRLESPMRRGATSDGVIVGEPGNRIYAVWSPDQIRGATDGGGEASPDISFRAGRESGAFKRWFGDSKVVDADGKPLVVYHGTTADFAEFDRDKIVSGVLGRGFYFAANPESTRTYSGGSRFGGAGFANGGNVMPVYLSIKNPLILEHGDKADIGAESKGHDGVIKLNKDGAIETLVAFRPEQIKSAIGNSGAFDPTNPDIRFRSARSVSDIKTRALDEIHKTMTHPGKVSFWDRSVGTMRHLAERNPAFKPVFEAAQRFIEDVSLMANDAADFAPRLIPRVDSWRDIVGKDRKKPISAADNKAVAAPLFEGTLMWGRDTDGTPMRVTDLEKKYEKLSTEKKARMLVSTGRLKESVLKAWQGLPIQQYESAVNTRFQSKILKAGVVWKDSELQSMFGANAAQISLYKEARQAIDRSIDMTTRTDMLRALGDEYTDMREQVLEAKSLHDVMLALTDRLQEDARANPDDNDRLSSLNNMVVTRYEKATELMRDGYAPLSRFGKYTVDVVDADGERQYFGMFETKRESNEMYAKMREEFPGGKVTQGTMSAEAYKLFAGITPESMELFGNMLGLDSEGSEAKDKAFQTYLALAKNNHSALKRLIHRKGIAGYSEDVGRVLASFIYSNARQAAGGLNVGTMENAVQGIPKGEGELKDVAMGLRSYIQDPQEEGQAIRGMLFAQYLGGSIASAMVNMTQPFTVTMPWLSQYSGMAKAGQQLSRAIKDMATKGKKYEAGLAEALKHAEDDGVVSPQEIHQLMAQARGAGALRVGDGTKLGDARAQAANWWERGKVAWGQPFALAEQVNRRSTFIAAYRTAVELKIPNPAEFAERAVLETQFLYSKSNKPKWARGAIGGTLFTFKTYSVSYLELMQRMWTQGGPEGKRAVGWAIAMLMLVGGAGGLPFMEDAEDLIDGAGQLMGYNVSAAQWRQELMREVLGNELADFMEHGLSGLPGAPIDVSGRLGMGNLIPGTGLFLTKQGRERDLLEVVGPAGDLISRGFTGARKALTGDLAGAALEISPLAVRNADKGVDMAISGIYKDTKGYKVIDTTLDEAIAKAIGFQPRSVAQVQEANSFMQRSKSFYVQTSSEIKAQWAQALFNKDDAALERVRERLNDWNENNPEQRITIKMPDIWKRVREIGKDRTERIADTAPKALRQQMRDMAGDLSK
ncbi:MAG: PLxRFG domain-containing protein [Desulfurellales bacterium]|nr:MAG: PLxRFG domain-containing protein [Desulfurellales bacterium]